MINTEKFVDSRRVKIDRNAYLFHHLEPGGMVGDWEAFDTVVEQLIQAFQEHRDTTEMYWNTVCEFLAMILSDLWEDVQ